MRNIFIKKLIKEAQNNKNIYLTTGDLGYRSFEEFSNKYSSRFINCGVAENNMVGIGAGLSLINKKVFVYSIAPFLVFRSLEQIRNNICHNNLDVKLIGGGGGFSYGEQGISHNPTEDFAIMMSMPNMKVFSPGTKSETDIVLESIFKDTGPCYIRLGKVPDFDFPIKKYELGKGITVKEGDKILILSTGNIIKEVLEASNLLEQKNISTKIVSFPCIKPLDKSFLETLINDFKYIFSVEEHNIFSGFGSSIFDTIDYMNKDFLFKRIGLFDSVHKEIGNQDHLRKIKKINSIGIFEFILNNI